MNKKIIASLSIIIILLGLLSTTCHASAEAKVFSSSKSPTYKNCAVYAVDGLSKLGYSPCTSSIGAITKTSMLQYIGRTDNNYGLYVHALGGQGFWDDYYGNRITASDLSGYWDFVFLDVTQTARDKTLANALHCIGYTNRCFLGWYNTVMFSDAETFGYYFWLEEVGRGNSIYSAAINAATAVPGAQSASIMLYGSTTYTGVAR